MRFAATPRAQPATQRFPPSPSLEDLSSEAKPLSLAGVHPRSSRPHRPHARCRSLPQFLPQAERRPDPLAPTLALSCFFLTASVAALLDACRLGVDRRLAGRRSPVLEPQNSRARVPDEEVRSRLCVLPDGQTQDQERSCAPSHFFFFLFLSRLLALLLTTCSGRHSCPQRL